MKPLPTITREDALKDPRPGDTWKRRESVWRVDLVEEETIYLFEVGGLRRTNTVKRRTVRQGFVGFDLVARG